MIPEIMNIVFVDVDFNTYQKCLVEEGNIKLKMCGFQFFSGSVSP